MEYIATYQTVYYITMAMNVCYGLLFLYHCLYRSTNNSLMIITGSLCVAAVIVHLFSSYQMTMDKSGWLYQLVTFNHYMIFVILNSTLMLVVFALHKSSNTSFHVTTRYVFRCLSVSILLSFAMHIDIMVLENSEPNWLWSVYSYGENLMTVFMFLSVLIARKWSEVFKWLQLAHAR